jgi:hypothetical protein
VSPIGEFTSVDITGAEALVQVRDKAGGWRSAPVEDCDAFLAIQSRQVMRVASMDRSRAA